MRRLPVLAPKGKQKEPGGKGPQDRAGRVEILGLGHPAGEVGCEKQPVIECALSPGWSVSGCWAFESSVAIEVWERCPGEPQLLPLDFECESGRGLMTVDALSVNCGFLSGDPEVNASHHN